VILSEFKELKKRRLKRLFRFWLQQETSR